MSLTVRNNRLSSPFLRSHSATRRACCSGVASVYLGSGGSRESGLNRLSCPIDDDVPNDWDFDTSSGGVPGVSFDPAEGAGGERTQAEMGFEWREASGRMRYRWA